MDSLPLQEPLSDEEYATLDDLLDAASPFDTDGLLGVLHAVAVAPSLVPPSAWLPIVIPHGVNDLDKAGTERLVGLVLRLFNVILDSVNRGAAFLMPEQEDFDGCAAFASGFAAGAQLDPTWIGDADRWTFASWAAYLGDRLDLVPDHTLAKLDAVGDARDTIRRDMPAIINAAHETFTKVRRAAISKQPALSAPRIGRNDPCPCGSGKKFKRCCLDQKPALDSH